VRLSFSALLSCLISCWTVREADLTSSPTDHGTAVSWSCEVPQTYSANTSRRTNISRWVQPPHIILPPAHILLSLLSLLSTHPPCRAHPSPPSPNNPSLHLTFMPTPPPSPLSPSSLLTALSPQPEGGYIKRDSFMWTEPQLQWFIDRGCEWVKPEMEPGDFVLWDSRTVHYGAAPLDQKKRFAICTLFSHCHIIRFYGWGQSRADDMNP